MLSVLPFPYLNIEPSTDTISLPKIQDKTFVFVFVFQSVLCVCVCVHYYLPGVIDHSYESSYVSGILTVHSQLFSWVKAFYSYSQSPGKVCLEIYPLVGFLLQICFVEIIFSLTQVLLKPALGQHLLSLVCHVKPKSQVSHL